MKGNVGRQFTFTEDKQDYCFIMQLVNNSCYDDERSATPADGQTQFYHTAERSCKENVFITLVINSDTCNILQMTQDFIQVNKFGTSVPNLLFLDTAFSLTAHDDAMQFKHTITQ